MSILVLLSTVLRRRQEPRPSAAIRGGPEKRREESRRGRQECLRHGPGSVPESIAWWLVDRLSRMLDPEEREVVQGDLMEFQVPAWRALHDVLSLLVCRQFAQWKTWRPWTALVVLVVPLGFALALNSVGLSASGNLYLWIVRNYRDINHAILHESHIELGRGVAMFVDRSLLLACWSWTAGFVLAAISRGATAVTGLLFCGIMWLGEVAAAPRGVYYVAGSAFPVHTSDLPLILLVLMVCLPAIWGMWKGRARPTLELLPALILAAAVAGLAAIGPTPRFWINWPVLYILIASIVQRRRAIATRSA